MKGENQVSAMKVNLIKSATPTHALVQKSLVPSLNNVDLVKSMPSADSKAYYENPIRMAEASNYKDKPSSLSYGILYQMSVKNSVISAVINTRVNQISTFTRPARFASDGIGFQIRLRDPQAVPTEEQTEVILAIETFLENCGYNDDSDRDDFDTFIRKIVRDSLTYDQMCFEIVPDRRGKPAEILAVDASTIRSASENFDYDNSIFDLKSPKKSDRVKWVQVVDGSVVSWFTARELAFGVRNPRTNINLQPYGFSELEMLIQQITSHLYAEEYNAKYFSQGGTTKGIINIKSDPNGIGNKEQLDSFKRQWRAQVNGMSGAWKTPVLQVPDGIEYISVNQSNRDMEYTQWVNYLINIVCAVYQIDPAEVNFANNGGAGGQSSVFESSQEAKLKNSKDKGLKPLLRFVESIINKFVVSKFSQDYVFVFTGIDEKTESDKADLESKNVKCWKTINEIRKDHGEEPLENGDVILDSSWLNYMQQQQMAQQQQDMGGDDDSEDDGGEYDDDSDQADYSDYDTDDDDQDEDGDGDGDDEDAQDEDDSSDEESDEDSDDTQKSLSKLIITLDE